MPKVNADDAKGFVGSLFDLSFNSFITTKLVKVLYVIGIIGALLTAGSLLLSGFAAMFSGSTQGTLSGVVLIVLAPVAFLALVIAARVYMEVIIVVFRAAEHLAEIAHQSRR